MTVDHDFVTSQLATMPEFEDFQIQLDPDTCITDKVTDDFVCIICKHVVIGPQLCSECQKMYCKKCIGDWGKINKACPYC